MPMHVEDADCCFVASPKRIYSVVVSAGVHSGPIFGCALLEIDPSGSVSVAIPCDNRCTVGSLTEMLLLA